MCLEDAASAVPTGASSTSVIILNYNLHPTHITTTKYHQQQQQKQLNIYNNKSNKMLKGKVQKFPSKTVSVSTTKPTGGKFTKNFHIHS